ncbi:unnamed protein product [Linum tenue]|uniref:Uncharacterized protein n=1 Tax=Linum tenue TaxID=586396 RepID=A0AAV0HDF9_9ROSI|nr:unnamed protein product [Linum tenue]CAI0412174.1 unnamed protein product [Linum tenue]
MAPGVNILAAFPPYLPGEDNSYGHPFRFLSGTSMACPHATATAAFVKSHRPHWSPAAVKSALMTTARVAKEQNPLAEYAYGSGEIDPVKALDPGLVYDMSFLDYVRFLCSEGYSNTSLSIMTDGGDVSCPSPSKYSDTRDFVNYPSMNLQVALDSTSPYAAVFERTVTNVGPAKSTYVATTTAPAGMEIRVVPARLEFEKVGEKKTFKVEQLGQEMDQVLSGSLVWAGSSGHRVRSPVVVSLAFVPL